MSTRWIDLRYPLVAVIALGLISAALPQRLVLVGSIIVLAILLAVGGWRYVTDQMSHPTNGGGFPSLGDAERGNDRNFDILKLEEEILTLLNHARQTRGVDPVALHSDLLYRARRHSLRMIKLPFFGTKDPEEGDLCDSLLRERGTVAVAAKVMRIRDDLSDPAAYCVGRWMRRRRTRQALLYPGFTLTAIGVIRSGRGRALYITCLLEAKQS